MNGYITTTSVALSGSESELYTYLNPPLALDPMKEYQIALIDFTTYNSIPNIYEGFNRFYYDNNKYVKFPTGSYEITAIEDFLKGALGKDKIQIIANNNTLQCEILSKYDLNFTHKDSIGSLLGFSPKVCIRNELHISDLPININKVNSINILCNIVSGSFSNGSVSHILHSFYPFVPPGHKIIDKPSNLIYLPINKSDKIDRITIKIVDQDNNLINFRNEKIFIRMHIKQWV